MLRLICDETPFRLFRSIRSFGIRGVKVYTIRSNEFMYTVRIRCRFIFYANFDDAMIGICRFLVVAVRGICLRSFRASVNVIFASILRVPVRYIGAYPRSSACILFHAVVCRFFSISFFRGLRRIDFRICYPTLVRGGVLGAVYYYGICMVFVDYVISSKCRICSIGIPVVPPIPYCFAKFSP